MQSNWISISKMEISDIDFIVAQEEEIFGHSLGKQMFHFELTENPFAKYFVVKNEETIIGYIGFRVYLPMAEVMNFLIIKEYQNQQIGSYVFKYLLAYLEKLGVTTLSLEVRASNKRAQSLYLRNGFTKELTRFQYYPDLEDAIVMIKKI